MLTTTTMDLYTILAVLSTGIVGYMTYLLFLRPLYFSSMKSMPSAKFVPIAGQMWELVREEAVVPQLRRTRHLGPIWRYFGIFGQERVLVAEPNAMKHILVTNRDNYERPAFLERTFRLLAGRGLLAISGKEHAMQRKILNPAFKRENLKAMVPSFQRCADVLVQYWEEALEGASETQHWVEVAAQEDFARLTLDVIGKCGFSYNFNSVTNPEGFVTQSVTKLLKGEGLGLRTVILLLPLVGSLIGGRFGRKRDLCMEVVEEVVAERKRLLDTPDLAEEDIPKDLLSLVMLSRDRDTGAGLPDDVIRDEVITFMVAGHDTTSIAMSWLLLELSRHPRVQDRLRSEVRAVLPSDDTPITWDVLDQIPYLTCVVKEALRLHSPAANSFKKCLKDDTLCGYPIPAGTVVNLAPAVMHRLSQYWENPDVFDPDRFADDVRRDPYTFLPFGAGPRMCIGNKFALAELRTVLAVLVRKFRFEPVPGVVYRNESRITVRPSPSLKLRVCKAQ